MFENNKELIRSAGEEKIEYAQINRFDTAKSCYIELGNLQKSGTAIDSEVQHLIGFPTF